MDTATEERLNRAWEHVWMEIQEIGLGCWEATRPVDSAIEDLVVWFKSRLSEDQARAFDKLLGLKEDSANDLHGLMEDLHFQLGFLVGCGRLIDLVPELLAGYPKRVAQEIEKSKMADQVLAEANNIRKSIDEGKEPPEPGNLKLV